MPLKERLTDLYINKKYSTNKIATLLREENPKYYGKINRSTVGKWLRYYEIPVRGRVEGFKQYYRSNEPPIPPKDQLIDLYTNQKLSSEKIAKILTEKSEKNFIISQKRVRKWLKIYKIPLRDPTTSLIGKNSHEFERNTDTYNIWHKWEIIGYELAEYILANLNWKSGHSEHKISITHPKKKNVKPEIIIYDEHEKIEKIIDIKSSDNLSHKDRYIYPMLSKNKTVEFWILHGESRVEIHFEESSKIVTLNDFYQNTEEYSNFKKIFIFINTNDLLNKLQLTDCDKNLILNFQKKIYDLRNQYSEYLGNFENISGHNMLPFPSKNLLVELYLNKKLSLMSIANKLKENHPDTYSTLTPHTVRRWLLNYNIKTRKFGEALKKPILNIPAKETLYDYYITNKLSQSKIATLLQIEKPLIYPKLSVTTVQKWLRYYDIPTRARNSINKSLPVPSKNKLVDYFVKKQYSLNKIATLLREEKPLIYPKLSYKTVKKWLKDENIIPN